MIKAPFAGVVMLALCSAAAANAAEVHAQQPGAPREARQQIVSPAPFEDGPRLAAAAQKAAQALSGYLDAVVKAGGRPDYAKPPAARHLADIFATEGLARLPPPGSADVPWLLEWIDAARPAFRGVLFFGATSAADAHVAAQRNTSDFENEIMSAQAFQLRLIGRAMPALEELMHALPAAERNSPVRQAGLAQAREGVLDAVRGAIVSVAQGARPANARIVASALNDTVQQWAGYAERDKRTELLRLLDFARSRTSDADAADKLLAVAAAITKHRA